MRQCHYCNSADAAAACVQLRLLQHSLLLLLPQICQLCCVHLNRSHRSPPRMGSGKPGKFSAESDSSMSRHDTIEIAGPKTVWLLAQLRDTPVSLFKTTLGCNCLAFVCAQTQLLHTIRCCRCRTGAAEASCA